MLTIGKLKCQLSMLSWLEPAMWALTTLNGLGYGPVGLSSDSFTRINFVSSYHLQLSVPYQPRDSDPLKAEKMSLHVHQTLSFILCTGLRWPLQTSLSWAKVLLSPFENLIGFEENQFAKLFFCSTSSISFSLVYFFFHFQRLSPPSVKTIEVTFNYERKAFK